VGDTPEEVRPAEERELKEPQKAAGRISAQHYWNFFSVLAGTPGEDYKCLYDFTEMV
jgi:hypothetical protein